jgi:hypothetical protein
LAKKRKKKARDMTTEEAIRVLFPKKVIERIKKALSEEDDEAEERQKKRRKKAE